MMLDRNSEDERDDNENNEALLAWRENEHPK
jgi:hypothetical protein